MPRAAKISLLSGLGLLALLLVVYVAGYFLAGDSVPKKTVVDGVAVGGMPADEARATIQQELAARAETPLTLEVGDRSAQVVPAAAGMTVDVDATVSAAGAGRSWNPLHIWRVLTGGGDLELVRHVDEAKLAQAVQATAPTFAIEPKDASVALEGAKIKRGQAVEGHTLNVDATARAAREAWTHNQTTVAAAVDTKPPAIDDAEADAVIDSFLKPALSGPIAVTAGASKFDITPAMIASAITITPKNDTLQASADPAKIYAAAKPTIDSLNLRKARDASFTFEGGAPKVVPSVDGETITPEAFAKAVEPAITKADARSVTVEVTKQPAKLTTDAAQKLGVKQVTGEFTTKYPHAPYRNTNLGRAASLINGTFVAPGETFSLNKVLGERTAANGFVEGYVINEGRLVKEQGGAVSQSATTTFNAIFFAGLEDVEHHPHSLYFPRYPAGREATLYYPSKDLKFRNDTPYGVLMQAYISPSAPGKQGAITVKVWSTKTYDVRSSELRKSNFYTGSTVEVTDPKCEPQAPIQGFTVNYERLFYKGGNLVKTEKFSHKYNAGNRIVCKKP